MRFKDLEFKPYLDWNGVQAKVNFENGYGASVIRAYGSYGYERGLYELAILKNDEICYDTEIASDVIGYLNESGVEDLSSRIQRLKGDL